MTYDLAIIGGGPAGVAAGVYASRKRLRTVFITKDFGGQSIVSEGIENWIGTVKIPGPELAKQLEAHLRAYAASSTGESIVDIKTGEFCESVSKAASYSEMNPLFSIKTNSGTYETRAVLVATGSDRRKLDVPGAKEFEHKGLTYCASCDGPLFADQDVAVIGGGNAGFESAAQLLAYCKSVTLLNRSDVLRADPSTIAGISKNPKIKIVMNAIPTQVKGDKFVNSLTYTENGAEKNIAVSGIFVEIGAIPTTSFVKDVVMLDPFNRVPVDPRTQETSTKGLWAAGDCTDGLYHQNNIAVGDAVKALENIYVHLSKKSDVA
jgi:alkyl hydroperoxide reductase subunit F